jgi:hypothetical protein
MHEIEHFQDIKNCIKGKCITQLTRGQYSFRQWYPSECRAYRVNLACLKKNRFLCFGDSTCLAMVDLEIKNVEEDVRHYCFMDLLEFIGIL